MLEVDVRTQDYASKINDWHNDDNAPYYEHLPLETFQQYAIAAGLDTCCDLELIRPQIMQANSILEVAAGYGRVVDGLRQMGYKKRIVAVERCKKFYSLLRTKQTEAVCADIRDFNSGEKFDVIFLLWAGIEEFALEEQSFLLLHLSRYLNIGGSLIFDSLSSSIMPKHAAWFINHCSLTKGENNSVLYAYHPSNQQIDQYIAGTGVQVKHFSYRTMTNRPRELHSLSLVPR